MGERETFFQELSALGLQPGDTVLMHSSMKSLGTKRTPEDVLDNIQDFLGQQGTLLLPALTYENVNAVHPAFDTEKTEPCIGLLPRVFWRMPGVKRSVNPTHSVCARGRLAHTLTVSHIMDDTPVGPHSPFMLLPVYAGKLLFIGDVLHACTFMHGIEEICMPAYLRPVRNSFIVNGQERLYRITDNYGWGSEFQRIENILSHPDLRKGKLGEANAYLIDTRALLATALFYMRSNPYAFVSDISTWI